MPVRIKICGITNVADAERAAELGADMIGRNFYTKSPRCIDDAMARSILDAIPDWVEPIGVFVNEPFLALERIARLQPIRIVQIHGDHQERLPPHPQWIPAFSVANATDLQPITAYLE